MEDFDIWCLLQCTVLDSFIYQFSFRWWLWLQIRRSERLQQNFWNILFLKSKFTNLFSWRSDWFYIFNIYVLQLEILWFWALKTYWLIVCLLDFRQIKSEEARFLKSLFSMPVGDISTSIAMSPEESSTSAPVREFSRESMFRVRKFMIITNYCKETYLVQECIHKCNLYRLINMRQLQSLFNEAKTWHQIVSWFSWISLFLPVLAWHTVFPHIVYSLE